MQREDYERDRERETETDRDHSQPHMPGYGAWIGTLIDSH